MGEILKENIHKSPKQHSEQEILAFLMLVLLLSGFYPTLLLPLYLNPGYRDQRGKTDGQTDKQNLGQKKLSNSKSCSMATCFEFKFVYLFHPFHLKARTKAVNFCTSLASEDLLPVLEEEANKPNMLLTEHLGHNSAWFFSVTCTLE